MKAWALGLLSFLLSLSAFGGENLCLDSKELQEIGSRFSINVDGTASNYACDPKSYNYKIAEALIFAKNLELKGKKISAPWSQKILGDSWLDYVESRSRKILSGAQDPISPDFCRGDVSAYVYRVVPDTMFFCSQSFNNSESNLSFLLSAILHEARHHDGHAHMNCTAGSQKGRANACDEKIQDQGSYAVSVETHARLAVEATNIHPTMKKLSLWSALKWAEHFNQPFRKTKAYTLLSDASGKHYYFDGRNLTPLQEGLLPEGQIHFRTSARPVIFPFDSNQPAEYFQTADGQNFSKLEVEGSVMQGYNRSHPDERARHKDFIYFENTKRYDVIVSDKTIELSVYPEERRGSKTHLVTGPWSDIVRLFTSQDIQASRTDEFYVLDSNDALFKIEFSMQDFNVNQIVNPFPNIVAITNLDSERFALDKEGRLHQFSDGRFLILERYKNLRFKYLARSSFYYLEDVEVQKLSR